MDPLWILTAFLLGFIVTPFGLAPRVGYLIAGFVLQAFGLEGGEALENIANLGVTLLLFTIGLKLRLRNLIKPEVWAAATIHIILTVIVFGCGIFTLGLAGLSVFAALDFKLSLLLAFALSFSSTVFALKVLTERKFDGIMAATAKFDDEVQALRETGVHVKYNFYADAGYEFAEHVRTTLVDQGKLGLKGA